MSKELFKKIYLEITNNCNLDCSFCIGNTRSKKFMSVNDFKLILHKLKDYTKYLYFHILGEPLLHPHINELIDLASSNFYVNITTNGYLIKRILNNKNIRQINISLHSFDLKYQKSLDDYMSDIFETVKTLSQNNTLIKYRLWTSSPSSKEIITKLNKQYHTHIDSDLTNARELKLSDNVFFEVEHEFIWPSLDNNYYSEIGSCRGTRDFIGILVSGDIIPCCLDSAGLMVLGNIYKDELSDIIRSDFYKSLKEGFQNNQKIHPLCRKCNFYELRR